MSPKNQLRWVGITYGTWLLSVLLAGCNPGLLIPAPPAGSPTNAITARLDQPFMLQFGQMATLPDANGLRVSFDTMIQDSRCPANAQCITAGRARVLIYVESGGKLARFDLATSGFDHPAVGEFNGYLVRFVALAPAPAGAGQSIPYSDYQVTMRVTKGSLATTRPNFDEPFTIKMGQSVSISDSTRLTFEAVTEDSRCPERVSCTVSGEATLTLALLHDGTTDRYNVEVAGKGEMTRFPLVQTVAGTLYAQALTPYPQSAMAHQEINPSEYQATLLVYNPAIPMPTSTPH